ncbi:ROK family transcriptional regulator [Agromyces sp. H3Y2-19a]|uniref:ROK family transcriptional regulator n=1 Tax=Agromyces TaxID=33877 RepID=UPI0023BA168C|nr:ROK family transcriptional regulator [Agromyces chromiiresistens]MDF0514261.1 ROK family transcriptional regulator [Agromyces chromiiresistens]
MTVSNAGPQRKSDLLRRFASTGGLDAQTAIRRENLLRALALIAREPAPVTRAVIARRTGLTSATASSLVAELIEFGLVTETGPAESTGGKRATRLEIDTETHLIVVAVVRTRAIDVALVDLAGRTVASNRVELAGEVEVSAVVDAVRSLLRAEGAESRVLAACVQVPGVTADGVVVDSVQLGWFGVPLASLLEEAIGAPTSVVNDVDAEALTEAADAADGAIRLVVHLGEGVGAAVTNGGTLMAGATGRAGEIGHVRVVFEGARATCRCGLSGCLESAASMSAMLGDAYTDEFDEHDTSLLASTAESRERMAFGARALSRALRIMSALLDPQEVVIAGAAPALGPHFLGTVRDEFEMYPAKGTAPVPIRYGRPELGRYLGPARSALAPILGDALPLTERPAAGLAPVIGEVH